MKRAKLKSYVSDSKEMLLKEVADMELLKSVETGAEYQKRMKAKRKVYFRSKQLHGKFFNIIKELAEERAIDLDRPRQWLKAGFFM